MLKTWNARSASNVANVVVCMKETALQRGAGLPAITSPPSNRGRADALPNESEPNAERWGTAALEQRRQRTRNHLAQIAARRESWINRNSYYYGLLNRLLRFLIELEKKVLSVRCGTGNLLAVFWRLSGLVREGIDIFVLKF